MAKKKKAQLKPVARGFATTSVPSKKALAEADAAASETGAQQATNSGATPKSTPSLPNEATTASNQGDPIDQVLQAIVDKWQDKVERDIARTLKVRGT
jgi:ATP-dependent RNA helicase DHX29